MGPVRNRLHLPTTSIIIISWDTKSELGHEPIQDSPSDFCNLMENFLNNHGFFFFFFFSGRPERRLSDY